MNIIQEFGNLSCLKLNKNKTEGIWLGRLKHTKDKYENITWTNEPISDPELKTNTKTLLGQMNPLVILSFRICL
jgi:hypothetical protein